MTRTGSTKTVPKDHWRGRLAKARGFLKLAKNGIDLHDPGDDPDVYCAALVKAAIGYADALTAATRQKVNQQDHKAIVQLLRDGFGNKLLGDVLPQMAFLHGNVAIGVDYDDRKVGFLDDEQFPGRP